jgi:uncharacterized protein YecT (DUF1311 family)
MKKHIFLFLFSCLNFVVFSQTAKTVNDLKTQYQNCLDKGEFMLGCSQTFYTQIDSLLNVAYTKRQAILNDAQKEKLRTEQRNWLVKRDIYFKKTLQEFKTKNPNTSFSQAQDDALLMHDQNAEFVMLRVQELMKK